MTSNTEKKYDYGAGEMGQWLRMLTALSEEPGSVPSTHIRLHNCLLTPGLGI